jgi:hypothetical protein
LDALLKGEVSGFRIQTLFKDPNQVEAAKNFLRQIATHDEKPEDVSLYDVYFETKPLHGENWKAHLLGRDFKASGQQRVRILGAPLVDPSSSAALSTQSRDLLRSLLIYAGGALPTRPESTLSATLEFFLSSQEPVVFANYLKRSFIDFTRLDEAAQSEIFRKAVQNRFPDFETAEKLFSYLTQDEAVRFIRECLRKDPSASLALFERIRFPAWEVDTKKTSDESDFFPNLPQDTPFPKRQKAIDNFLGEPILTLKRKYAGDGGTVVRTTIKKYRWVGDTEVFSIESGKPGPTTVVFSPHYYEQNPRKMFHWLKDLPLKTGRVIFIPEANRAMALADGNARPMNNLFNKAFRDDRMDYLVIRRTEYLMGLVDGMIGLHDWTGRKPFYISDVVVDTEGKADPRLNPTGSPWIPKDVKQIAKFSHDATLEADPYSPGVAPQADPAVLEGTPQIQWQIADYSATKLEKLTGETFAFTVTPLAKRDSYRMDNSTAYMNYFLKKPAMTFEGTAEAEQGQLLAKVVYTLLLGYGHSIDQKFEEKLNDPSPAREPDLYQGVPTRDSVAK